MMIGNLASGMKALSPWWLRLILKIIFSRLPFDYRILQKLGAFRHGKADSALYATSVFDLHAKLSGWCDRRSEGQVILELGPGDGIGTCIIASSLGARAILIDAGDFATMEVKPYEEIARAARHPLAELIALDDKNTISRNDVLIATSGAYLVDGLHSLKQLRTGSVDFIFSNAVLEHIELHEVKPIITELARVLKPDGIMSHRIDLKDHMGGSLNNLRFSARIWERPLIYRSGCYTNRLRASDFIEAFESEGLEIRTTEIERWEALPIPKQNLAKEFGGKSLTDLRIKAISLSCTPHRYDDI